MPRPPFTLVLAAVAATMVAASPLPARTQPQGDAKMPPKPDAAAEARNRALVEDAFARWGQGVGGPYDLLDETVTWTIVGRSDASRVYAGREAFMSEVIRPFNARMRQGLKPTIRQITTDDDKVVIFFDAAGVAKDGQAYTNTYAWFWEMRDGRVVRAHAFFDSIAFNDLWRRVAP